MRKMTCPRILLAEDEKLLCELLAKQLQESFTSCTIRPVSTLKELDTIDEEFDLAVVDLALADGSSLPWVNRWTSEKSGRKVLIITSRDQDYILHGIINSAVAGLVHKSDGIQLLEIAIKAVLAGGTFFSPKIQELRARSGADPTFFAKILSPREQEVLKRVAEGMSYADIACELGVKELTVVDHRKNIMQKLGLHSQAELISYAVEKGFVHRVPSIKR